MDYTINHRFKVLALAVAVFFLLFLGMESLALARAGGGRSSGSSMRSSGSYQRSSPSGSYQRTQPMAPMAQPAPRSSMGRTFLAGLGGGLAGGMLGSMLFGGRGYAGGGGGWGGGGGGFGFGDLIFLIIILAIIYFVWKHFRQKRQAMEYSSVGDAYGTTYAPTGYNQPVAAYEPPPSQQDLVYEGLRRIREMDPSFDEIRFKEDVEDSFFKIQSAWTRRDLSPVRHLFTPQMLSTFQEDVNRYMANKQINRLENIAVRQVDIVDVVQDQGQEYITVKFLASLLDYVTDDTGGQVLSGSTTDPVKFLEYWNFTRRIGDRTWVLAGITQEGDY
jgi:predicted lipid-binding transport protein (Tim44 family)